jgi:hypothetical protein
MRKIAFLVLTCALAFCHLASATTLPASDQKRASGDIPPIILSGLDTYKDKGPDEAVKAWIKGSPIEGSKDALSQANSLRQVQDFYGTYRSFDVIEARDLTTKTRILYLVMNYDSGPLFAKFVVYRAEKGWILTSFNFNTHDEIIPSSIP